MCVSKRKSHNIRVLTSISIVRFSGRICIIKNHTKDTIQHKHYKIHTKDTIQHKHYKNHTKDTIQYTQLKS